MPRDAVVSELLGAERVRLGCRQVRVTGRLLHMRTPMRRLGTAALAVAILTSCATGEAPPVSSTQASGAADGPSTSTDAPAASPSFSFVCPPASQEDADFIEVVFPWSLPPYVESAPYSLDIDYGDGRFYAGSANNPAAVFSHRYRDPGDYLVQATLTEAGRASAQFSCQLSWTRLAALPAIGTCYPTSAMPDLTQGEPRPCASNAFWTITSFAENRYGCNVLGVPVGGGRAEYACLEVHPSGWSQFPQQRQPQVNQGGDGYAVLCVDGTLSYSGGQQGACSSHGGVS